MSFFDDAFRTFGVPSLEHYLGDANGATVTWPAGFNIDPVTFVVIEDDGEKNRELVTISEYDQTERVEQRAIRIRNFDGNGNRYDIPMGASVVLATDAVGSGSWSVERVSGEDASMVTLHLERKPIIRRTPGGRDQ